MAYFSTATTLSSTRCGLEATPTDRSWEELNTVVFRRKNISQPVGLVPVGRESGGDKSDRLRAHRKLTPSIGESGRRKLQHPSPERCDPRARADGNLSG